MIISQCNTVIQNTGFFNKYIMSQITFPAHLIKLFSISFHLESQRVIAAQEYLTELSQADT